MRIVKYGIFLVIFALVVFSIIQIIPETIYFSKTTDKAQADILVLVLVFIIPLILIPFILPRNFLKIYICFAAFGFIGYTSGNYYRNQRAKKELKHNFISTKGVIKGKKYFSGGKGSGQAHWEFFCEFIDDDSSYKTFYITDPHNKLKNGDSLEVMYLKRNPEISEVIFPKDYNLKSEY